MSKLKIGFLLLFYICTHQFAVGQTTVQKSKSIYVNKSIDLDTLSIYPNSFQVTYGGENLPRSDYQLDFSSALFVLNRALNDTLHFKYQVLPIDLSKQYRIRDTNIIYSEQKDNYSLFKIENSYSVQDVFGGSQLNKNGSISRGVSFGNNQDLGINSSLNLELSGNISPDLKILASAVSYTHLTLPTKA